MDTVNAIKFSASLKTKIKEQRAKDPNKPVVIRPKITLDNGEPNPKYVQQTPEGDLVPTDRLIKLTDRALKRHATVVMSRFPKHELQKRKTHQMAKEPWFAELLHFKSRLMLGLAHRRKQAVPRDSGSAETNIAIMAGGPLALSRGPLDISTWWNNIYKLMGNKALYAQSSSKTINDLQRVHDECTWKGTDERLPFPFEERARHNRFESIHLDGLGDGTIPKALAITYLPPVGGLKRSSGLNLYNILGVVRQSNPKAKDAISAYEKGAPVLKKESVLSLRSGLYTKRVKLPSQREGIKMVILPNKGEIAHSSAPHVYKEGADPEKSSKPFYRLML